MTVMAMDFVKMELAFVMKVILVHFANIDHAKRNVLSMERAEKMAHAYVIKDLQVKTVLHLIASTIVTIMENVSTGYANAGNNSLE